MPARPATDRKTQRRVRLDHRRRGYLLDGELQAGFVDRPELPDRERIAIARWARSFSPDRLSDVQRELLDSPAARRTVSQAQRELQANQRELQLPYVAALSDLLSDRERRVVADPSKALGKEEDGYPLTVGQLARLTDLSERQVRRWADEELLPCFRDEGARRFYSAALIRAFALSDAPTHEKAVLSEAAQGHAGRLFALLAATLARTRAAVAPEHVESLDALAHELSNSSRLMTESRGDRPTAAQKRKSSQKKRRVASASRKKRGKDGGAARNRPLIEVVQADDGRWIVQLDGAKQGKGYSTKKEAIPRARHLAKRAKGEYVVHRRDGSVSGQRSYAKTGP